MLFHYSDLWSSNGSFIILCVAVCVSLFFHRRKQLPIPVVGVSTALDGFGLRVLGVVANIFNTRDLLEKGYKKYGLQNKAFYIPQLEADNILIPPAWFKAYKRAPATDLSLDGAIEANLQVSYLLGPQIRENSYHIEWSRDSLTSLMPSYLPWIEEEIDDSLNELLAETDEDFRKVEIFSYVMSLNCRIGSRILVGKTLCRDPAFLKLFEDHAQLLVVLGMILKFLPTWCRAYIVALSPLRKVQQQIIDLIQPAVLEDYRILVNGGDISTENSLLGTLVRTALSKAESATDEKAVVREVSLRILNIMFLFTGSPTLVLANVLLDLVSQPRSLYHAALEAEITSAYGNSECAWTPDSLHDLKLTDSFIKESMRLRPAALTIAGRTVTNPSGYTLPDSSVTLPYGSYCTLPMYAIHRDKNHYPPRASDGNEFDGFRFLNSSTGINTSLVGSSETFLSWGAGRHICPGRFASAAITKMCLAQFVLKCEYQSCDRLKDRTFANIYVPSRKVVVEIRKKKT